MRLGVRDQRVLRAFVEHRPLDGDKLSTDGQRVDGHWLGGARIADWTEDGIVFHDKGSRAAESVQRQIRAHAAPMQLARRERRRSRDPRRFVLRRTDTMPGRSGAYTYGPAKIWVSGPVGGTWWATVRFRQQEKDFDARNLEGVLAEATRWVDAAPELGRRDAKRPKRRRS